MKLETRFQIGPGVAAMDASAFGAYLIATVAKSTELSFLLPMPIDEDDTDYGLVVPDRMPEAEIEIGFELKRSAWGKGYATEACKRVLQFAFEETPLNEVVASFYEENIAARNVLEKSGLFDRGRMWCYGEDCPNYRITRNEWMESQENL